MRALLKDARDQTLIAFEVEEATYYPDRDTLDLYSSSGTCYAVCGLGGINAKSMIKDLFTSGKCDFSEFDAEPDDN